MPRGSVKSREGLAKSRTGPLRQSTGKSLESASPAGSVSAAVRLELHPEAEDELFHDAAWYDDQRLGLGDEFLEHVYRWFAVVLESPNIWPRWADTPTDLDPIIRRLVIDRFPYSVAYQVFADHVLVLAVAHASREPLYRLTRTVP